MASRSRRGTAILVPGAVSLGLPHVVCSAKGPQHCAPCGHGAFGVTVQYLSCVCTFLHWLIMPKTSGKIRKNLRLTQAKLVRAQRILGTATETDTVEQALDLVAFRQEVIDGVRRVAGTRSLRDVFRDHPTR